MQIAQEQIPIHRLLKMSFVAPLAIMVVGPSMIACRHSVQTRNIIVLDDSQEKDKDPAIEFASAFALDSTCKGLMLKRFSSPGFSYPDSPYWALDAFYARGAGSEGEVPYMWNMAHGGGTGGNYTRGSSPSVAGAVREICFIVNQQGGQVQ